MMTTAQAKPVNLALQGGGAHGAFTWGVLDQLLEDGRIQFEGVSGTSAGAMNAVVLADGYHKGGRDGAREALYDFWYAVSQMGHFSPIKRTPFDILFGNWSLDHSPTFAFFDMLSRMISPYDINPANTNPLRDLLQETINFENVRLCDAFKLYISATNVHTGRVKVFERHEMSAEMVMASACLPYLFQAVEIDKVPYWDGGYMGNPVLFPFFKDCSTNDVVIVKINPIERKETPKSAQEIRDRINEITFNASLMREFRAIDFVRRLIERGSISDEEYAYTLVHIINDHTDEMKDMGASSKLNSEWAFFQHLHDLGRDSAAHWLEQHYDKVGHQSSVDLRALFL